MALKFFLRLGEITVDDNFIGEHRLISPILHATARRVYGKATFVIIGEVRIDDIAHETRIGDCLYVNVSERQSVLRRLLKPIARRTLCKTFEHAFGIVSTLQIIWAEDLPVDSKSNCARVTGKNFVDDFGNALLCLGEDEFVHVDERHVTADGLEAAHCIIVSGNGHGLSTRSEAVNLLRLHVRLEDFLNVVGRRGVVNEEMINACPQMIVEPLF